VSRLLTFVRVDGNLLRVSIRGEGQPLLLVMGLGGNIEMWDPLEQALNGCGIQTIAYDASGTGDSPARLVPLRMAGLARHAAYLLATLGFPTADVLGVSFGGAVAQSWRTHPGVSGASSSPSTCGLGVPGHPVALALCHAAAVLLARVPPAIRQRPLRANDQW
jgi:pimeloyl-ACP methyl ester carboxylesterase